MEMINMNNENETHDFHGLSTFRNFLFHNMNV